MRNIELAYLLIAYAMAGIIFFVTRGKKFKTFSHSALGSTVARQTFFWGLFITGMLFVLLVEQWFIPHFSLGNNIRVLAFALLISTTLTGFFPVEHERLGKFHLIFGSAIGICMITILGTLALTSTIHDWVRILNGAAIFGMLIVAVSTKWTMKYTKQLITHEFIFFALWHAAILITTYFG